MIFSFYPKAHSCHPFHKCNNYRLIFILQSENAVYLPMSEFISQFDAFGAILNTSAEPLFVFSNLRFCCIPLQLFGQVDVFNFTKYIHILRIQYAQELIRKENDISLSEIASLCGYDSPNYFSNTFKKITGLSPSAYRKKSKSEHEANN